MRVNLGSTRGDSREEMKQETEKEDLHAFHTKRGKGVKETKDVRGREHETWDMRTQWKVYTRRDRYQLNWNGDAGTLMYKKRKEGKRGIKVPSSLPSLAEWFCYAFTRLKEFFASPSYSSSSFSSSFLSSWFYGEKTWCVYSVWLEFTSDSLPRSLQSILCSLSFCLSFNVFSSMSFSFQLCVCIGRQIEKSPFPVREKLHFLARIISVAKQ